MNLKDSVSVYMNVVQFARLIFCEIVIGKLFVKMLGLESIPVSLDF